MSGLRLNMAITAKSSDGTGGISRTATLEYIEDMVRQLAHIAAQAGLEETATRLNTLDFRN